MKTGLLFTATGSLLLLLLFILLRGRIWFRASAVDIHLFDTYFVIAYFYFILFLILALGTFFFMGSNIATGFRNKYFLSLLLVFVLADAYQIWIFKGL